MPETAVSSKKPAVLIKNVSVMRDGHSVLENITVSIARGETAVLVGANGSGKTTLLRVLMGLLPYDVGSIRLYGKTITRARGDIGYVPQGLPFDRTFPVTAAEVVGMNLWNAGLQDEERRARVIWSLEQVRARDVARKQVGELSGGQIQRVLIARAIVRRPRLLIFDEPATGIDAQGEEEFYDLLRRLKVESERTILMVSHDIDVVYKYATHVICLNRKLLCEGAPKETLTEDVLQEMYGDESSIFHHTSHHP